MKNLRLNEILKNINGKINSDYKNIIINNVITQPYKLKDNTLFFCFNKKKLISYIDLFSDKTVLVVQRLSNIPQDILKKSPIVLVDNVTNSFWNFVDYYRNLFNIPVIGITGTCGKTTTTEMMKTILSKEYNIQATHNGCNSLSMNLSYLLGIEENTDVAVFEIGVTHPGNIIKSCKYFKPQIGVILNIGTYHLLGCKTLENYIKAKAEILKGLDNKGTLILNKDDTNINKIDLNSYKGEIIYFAINNKDSHFIANDIEYSEGGMKFTLTHDNLYYEAFVPSYGYQNVYNALATIAASYYAGVSIINAIERLKAFKPMKHHMQIKKGINGSTIIDDSWNCTPLSAKCALKVLKDMSKSNKTVAIFSGMQNLGEEGFYEYSKIGEKVVETNVDILIIIENEAKEIANKALELGFNKNNIYYCKTADELYETLASISDQDTIILFKFSYYYDFLKRSADFRAFMKKIFI